MKTRTKKTIILLLIAFPLVNFAQSLPFDFDAKGFVVLSDADMVSSAYINGELNTEADVQDALTTISWGQKVAQIETSTLNVPNSVTNWVDGMDISKDGKLAFVVDTKGSLSRSIQKVGNVFNDLPQGDMLYAIDISDLGNPKLLDKIQVGKNPLAVSVHPTTGKILIISREKGKEVNLVDWQENKFSERTTFGLEFDEKEATHGIWHPSKNIIAITLEPSMEVAFYNIEDNKKMKPIGKPLKIGEFAGAGKFSQNGDFYLIPDLKWNQGYNVTGALVSVAFLENGKHSIASAVDVGISPEGFAISPDGTTIAVSNMGTNFMPMDFELFGQDASITLISFDENNGNLRSIDSRAWKGILPEGIAFDVDGDMLVLTSFDTMDIVNRRGYLSFWKILKGENGSKQLLETGFELTVTRGSHYIKVLE